MLSSSPKWSIFLARSDIQFNARLSFVLADSLQEGRDTMKRTTIVSLVLVLILLTTTPLLSQTRPRRVGRTTNAPVEEPIARPRRQKLDAGFARDRDFDWGESRK